MILVLVDIIVDNTVVVLLMLIFLLLMMMMMFVKMMISGMPYAQVYAYVVPPVLSWKVYSMTRPLIVSRSIHRSLFLDALRLKTFLGAAPTASWFCDTAVYRLQLTDIIVISQRNLLF